MASGKHRKRSKFTSPKFLGVALFAYAAAALLTFDLITPSALSITAQVPVATDLTLDTTTSQPDPTAPVHSQPELRDLATDLTTTNAAAPTTSPVPTVTATTTKAPPVVPQVAKPPPLQTQASTPPVSGDGSFRAKFYNAAKRYINGGIPYVYGGKSLTTGADCSGFIWRIIQQFSPNQPYRTSYALDDWTTNISLTQALPGDLMFWPDHVAVYAGNNQVISQGGPSPGPFLETIWPGYTVGRIPL